MLWRSSIFGDAFPEVAAPSLFQQFESIYHKLGTQFTEILTHSMPEAPEALIHDYVLQIAPKTTAFSVAISAGEVEDATLLQQIALIVALNYWADHVLDRGDQAMAEALDHYLAEPAHPPKGNRTVRARWEGLMAMEAHIRRLALPEDVPLILHYLRHETVAKQVEWHRYSLEYLSHRGLPWQHTHLRDIVACSIRNSGLITVATIIYAAYRRQDPQLPSLEAICKQPALLPPLQGPCQAVIRVFDDVGDREIDSGALPHWGEFSLNLFNHSDPRLIDEFLFQAGFENSTERQLLGDAFLSTSLLSQVHIIQSFIKLANEQMGTIPEPLWQRYQIFLTLCKRLLEAGYVNAVGDQMLEQKESVA